MISYVTVATRPHRQLDVLQKQYKDQGIDLHVLGMGNNDLTPENKGVNWGVKLEYFRLFVQDPNRNPSDILVFTDAYDVLLNGSLDDLVAKYKDMKCDIIFGAEANCHPYPMITDIYPPPPANAPYPYLNSGMFMGTVEAIARIYAMFDYTLATDDQGYWTRVYLSQYVEKSSFTEGNSVITLDFRASIFQNMLLAGEHMELEADGTYRNRFFETRPNFLHFPGSQVKGLLSICERKEPISSWSAARVNMLSEAGIMLRYCTYNNTISALIVLLVITLGILVYKFHRCRTT